MITLIYNNIVNFIIYTLHNRLGDAIGSGQFGNVQKAVWQKSNGESIEVAVKTLQEGSSEKEKIKFLQEAVIMSQFNHANVIKLYGVVADDNLVSH